MLYNYKYKFNEWGNNNLSTVDNQDDGYTETRGTVRTKHGFVKIYSYKDYMGAERTNLEVVIGGYEYTKYYDQFYKQQYLVTLSKRFTQRVTDHIKFMKKDIHEAFIPEELNEFKIGDKVRVFDRYRFASTPPVYGVIITLGSVSGVEVELIKGKNPRTHYKPFNVEPGAPTKTVWVSPEQLRFGNKNDT